MTKMQVLIKLGKWNEYLSHTLDNGVPLDQAMSDELGIEGSFVFRGTNGGSKYWQDISNKVEDLMKETNGNT